MLTMNNYSFYTTPERGQSCTYTIEERKKKDKGKRQQRTQKENQLPSVIEEETSETTPDILNTDPVMTKKKSGIKGFIRTCCRKVSPLQRKGYNKLSKDNN